jgi:hypothetical protein
MILIYVPFARDIFELEALGLREWIALAIAYAGLSILCFATQSIIRKKFQ